MGNTHTWINSYIHMNNDITIHRVVYWIYYERVEGICEQVVKYFFILLLNIYNEFADFITAGKIFHNLGALFRIVSILRYLASEDFESTLTVFKVFV